MFGPKLDHQNGKIKIGSNLGFEHDIPSFGQYFSTPRQIYQHFHHLNNSVNTFRHQNNFNGLY